MYIPSSFFGAQNSCFTVTTTKISGSGAISSGSFVSGGFTWDYYRFANTVDTVIDSSSAAPLVFRASINILSGSTSQAKLFLVGGGGAGGHGTGSVVSGFPETAGGGGGGGGIVYYDQFPLSSGSYTIEVGAGGGNALNGFTQGRQGGDTTFQYKIPYTPFTSSILTAYGGGKGGYVTGYPDGINQGVSGGSAGGAVVSYNQTGFGTLIQAGFDGFGGINGENQGNDSGVISASVDGPKATGGGGAGAASPSLPPNITSKGGDGALYNLTGTALYYAGGGGGAYAASPTGGGAEVAAQGSGSAGFGNGGAGKGYNRTADTTATSGVAIVVIPRCITY